MIPLMGNTELIESTYCNVIDSECIEGKSVKLIDLGCLLLRIDFTTLSAKIHIHQFDDNLVVSKHIPKQSWFSRIQMSWKSDQPDGSCPKIEVRNDQFVLDDASFMKIYLGCKFALQFPVQSCVG